MNEKQPTSQDNKLAQQITQHLKQTPVPTLSDQDKDRIFRQAWQQSHTSKLGWSIMDFLRRPAISFSLGLALGCIAMAICLRPQQSLIELNAPVLTIESLGSTQAYSGKTLQGLYPHIENPKIVVEKPDLDSESRRVLYGTLDDGEVYVVWNL